MAACSGTLAAFFESSSTLYSREYHVENVDGKNLKKIVNCCYTGKITLDHDCVVDIKKVANQLGLTYLDAKCDEYFAGKLSCENCVPYYYMCADGLCVWKTKTFEMICKEFKRLTPYHLQQMEIELILHVLRSNKIDAPEELVFGKIKDWVASNEAKRAQYIPGLMNNIRFERIDEIVSCMEVVCCLFRASI